MNYIISLFIVITIFLFLVIIFLCNELYTLQQRMIKYLDKKMDRMIEKLQEDHNEAEKLINRD